MSYRRSFGFGHSVSVSASSSDPNADVRVFYAAIGLFGAIGLGTFIGGVAWLMSGPSELIGPIFLVVFGLFFLGFAAVVAVAAAGLARNQRARRAALDRLDLTGRRVEAAVVRVGTGSRGWELVAVYTDPVSGREAHFVHSYVEAPAEAPAVGALVGVRYDPHDPAIYRVEVE